MIPRDIPEEEGAHFTFTWFMRLQKCNIEK